MLTLHQSQHLSLEQLPVAAFLTDSDGGIVYFNQRAVTLWGGEPSTDGSALIGPGSGWDNDGSLLVPGRTPASRVIESGTAVYDQPVVIERADGRRVAALLSAEPLVIEGEAVAGALCVLGPATAPVEAHLQQTIERYQALVETMGPAVYATDAEGRVTFFNDAAVQLWGRTPVAGQDLWCGSWRIFDHDGEPVALDDCPMAVALRSGEPVRGAEIVVERPDGGRSAVLVYPTPLHDTQGLLIGAVNVLIDISDRRRVEDALRESEERFRAMADAAPVLIWIGGVDKAVTHLNKAWLEFRGRSADEELGSGWLEGVHPEDRERCFNNYVEAFDRREPFWVEYRLLRQDGEYRWMMAQGVPMTTPDNIFIGYIGCCVDITDRHEADTALQRAYLLKDQFLSLISHELRTPISTILGNAVLLQKRGSLLGEDDKLQAYSDIVTEGRKLLGNVENLLMLTRLEPGQLDSEPVALPALVQKAIETFRETAPDRIVSVQIEPDLPPVMGQETLIPLVLQNLLTNAAKYSPADSEIQILVGRGGEGRLEVRVRDHGIGIDAEDAQNLFTPFFRSQKARTYAKGMGLGLAVCARILEVQDGTIAATARPEGGSDFFFTLPEAGSA